MVGSTKDRQSFKEYPLQLTKDRIILTFSHVHLSQNGCTALMYAASDGRTEIACIVLEFEADVNSTNKASLAEGNREERG